MIDRDPTEELMRRYFSDEVAAQPNRPAPSHGRGARGARGARGSRSAAARTPRQGTFGLVVAKVAIAAAIAVTIFLPFTEGGRDTPSARSLASIHESLDSGRVIAEGLSLANAFMRTHFSGEETDD